MQAHTHTGMHIHTTVLPWLLHSQRAPFPKGPFLCWYNPLEARMGWSGKGHSPFRKQGFNRAEWQPQAKEGISGVQRLAMNRVAWKRAARSQTQRPWCNAGREELRAGK